VEDWSKESVRWVARSILARDGYREERRREGGREAAGLE